MIPCPTDETLNGLLNEALPTNEERSIADHVEVCDACQSRLNLLTKNPAIEAIQQGERALAPSQAEAALMERVKQYSPASTLAIPTVRSLGPEKEKDRTNGDSADWPTIPGYEILGELGRGGMGVVYQARQLGLNRIVALKMVLNDRQAGPNELARFRAEAAALARLHHPNIVQIFDVGEAQGRPYFVLEFVPGGSLAHRLHGVPQPSRASAHLVETLARAIHAAHGSGVIHRDLKPANILLDFGPQDPANAEPSTFPLTSALPKITDFGVAKLARHESDSKDLRTATGEILGTPNYMAPEQAMVTGVSIGPTVDIYALGAILYELLTGRPPFAGETPLATVLQTLHNDPVSVTSLQPGVPRNLETICLKCLRKEPNKRYATASELAEDLRRFQRDEAILARPATPVEKMWRWMRRHPVPTGLLAAALVAPAVALVVLSFLSAHLVRSSALESAAQQAELLEEATKEFARNVERVQQAKFTVNKTVPPTPDTVPLSIPATFLHDVGERLSETGKTGVKVRQYSDYPFPWRKDGGPRDDFERKALVQLRLNQEQKAVHEFTELEGQRVVRFAQARVMQRACVDCHNTHPQSGKKDWNVGDVRGVLVVTRPLDKDETRVGEALRLALLASGAISIFLLGGSIVLMWIDRRRAHATA